MKNNTLPTSNQKNLVEIFIRSVVDLVICDNDLFQKNVHEQSLSHRLAVYIEKYFKMELEEQFAQQLEREVLSFDSEEKKLETESIYFNEHASVDCEYNKHEYHEKRLELILQKYPEKASDIVRPDIVLHVRGGYPNHMVIELTKGGEQAFEYAFDKVSCFVESDYNYDVGIVLQVDSKCEEESYIVKIATVRKSFSTKNNTKLLNQIKAKISQVQGEIEFGEHILNQALTENNNEDNPSEVFFNEAEVLFKDDANERLSNEDYEERRSHSDDINEMWWNDNEEGWAYEDCDNERA